MPKFYRSAFPYQTPCIKRHSSTPTPALATYAIGDIQGCFNELCDLLRLIDWQPQQDTLWLAGDLVNRGPQSLDVLRFVKNQGDNIVCVLGNHDLHLLATHDSKKKPRRSDTFVDVLEAKDCEELLQWLRCQPLIHHDPALDFVMVHAGLPSQWGLEESLFQGERLSHALRGSERRNFFTHMYGDQPSAWSENLSPLDQLRFATNAFTRMRFCDVNGALVMGPTGAPDDEHSSLVPWYAVETRQSKSSRIVFGHWATLQQFTPIKPEHNVFHIDTGCVWGGNLTALRLNDLKWFTVPNRHNDRK